MSDGIEENKSYSGFWFGVLLGGVIGAVAAYLAVEDKSKLRKELIKKGKVLLNHWEDFKDEAQEKGEEIKGKIADKAKDVKEEIKERVEEIPEVAKEAVENVQKTADKAIAEIVETADKTEMNTHKLARKFFLSKGKPLVKR